MSSIVTEIVGLLTSGITQMATGLGAGLKSLVEAIFITGDGTTSSPYALSTFGAVAIVFAGVSLCIGLSRFIVFWVTSLGN